MYVQMSPTSDRQTGVGPQLIGSGFVREKGLVPFCIALVSRSRSQHGRGHSILWHSANKDWCRRADY